MKTTVSVLLIVLTTINIEAQNLVANPGFELFYDCPIRIGEFSKTKEWFSANTGTPELYHKKCETFFFNNFEQPYSGEGYAGLIFHCQYKDAIEYIGTELIDSMKAGEDYCVGFQVKAKESPFYIANIGATLTEHNPSITYWGAMREGFDIRNKNGYISPEMGWVEVKSYYHALGGERYLVIGNFASIGQTSTLADQNGVAAVPGWMSYYYIDDVFVKKLSTEGACPQDDSISYLIEASLPKESMPIIIYFDFDSYVISEAASETLSSLKELSAPNDSILIIAHTDSYGSDGYNFLLSERRAVQTAKYLKEQIGLTNPIKISFEGETFPIGDNLKANGRANNRRAELKIIPNE